MVEARETVVGSVAVEGAVIAILSGHSFASAFSTLIESLSGSATFVRAARSRHGLFVETAHLSMLGAAAL